LDPSVVLEPIVEPPFEESTVICCAQDAELIPCQIVDPEEFLFGRIKYAGMKTASRELSNVYPFVIVVNPAAVSTIAKLNATSFLTGVLKQQPVLFGAPLVPLLPENPVAEPPSALQDGALEISTMFALTKVVIVALMLSVIDALGLAPTSPHQAAVYFCVKFWRIRFQVTPVSVIVNTRVTAALVPPTERTSLLFCDGAEGNVQEIVVPLVPLQAI